MALEGMVLCSLPRGWLHHVPAMQGQPTSSTSHRLTIPQLLSMHGGQAVQALARVKEVACLHAHAAVGVGLHRHRLARMLLAHILQHLKENPKCEACRVSNTLSGIAAVKRGVPWLTTANAGAAGPHTGEHEPVSELRKQPASKLPNQSAAELRTAPGQASAAAGSHHSRSARSGAPAREEGGQAGCDAVTCSESPGRACHTQATGTQTTGCKQLNASSQALPTHRIVLVVGDEQIVGTGAQDVLAAARPTAAARCSAAGRHCRPRCRLQRPKPGGPVNTNMSSSTA